MYCVTKAFSPSAVKSDISFSPFSPSQVQKIVFIQSVVVVMKTSGTSISFKHWINCGMCTAYVALTAGKHSTKGSVSFARVIFSVR